VAQQGRAGWASLVSHEICPLPPLQVQGRLHACVMEHQQARLATSSIPLQRSWPKQLVNQPHHDTNRITPH
jgi:hypothetical protein